MCHVAVSPDDCIPHRLLAYKRCEQRISCCFVTAVTVPHIQQRTLVYGAFGSYGWFLPARAAHDCALPSLFCLFIAMLPPPSCLWLLYLLALPYLPLVKRGVPPVTAVAYLPVPAAADVLVAEPGHALHFLPVTARGRGHERL